MEIESNRIVFHHLERFIQLFSVEICNAILLVKILNYQNGKKRNSNQKIFRNLNCKKYVLDKKCKGKTTKTSFVKSEFLKVTFIIESFRICYVSYL